MASTIVSWYADPQWWAIIAAGVLALASIAVQIWLELSRRRVEKGAKFRAQYIDNPEVGRDGLRLVNVGGGTAWDVSVTLGFDPTQFQYPQRTVPSVPVGGMYDPGALANNFTGEPGDILLTPQRVAKMRELAPNHMTATVTWHDAAGGKPNTRVLAI